MSKRLISKIDDIPLNIKLNLLNIICILIPIIIINFVLYTKVSFTVTQREKENNQISLERAQKEIGHVFMDAISVSETISASDVLYKNLTKTFQSSEDYYITYYNELRKELAPYNTTYTYIKNISIFVNNPTIKSGGNY